MALFGRKKEPEKKPEAKVDVNDPLAGIEDELAAPTFFKQSEGRSPSMDQVKKFDSLQGGASSASVPKPAMRQSMSSANIPLPGGRTVSNSMIPKGEEATAIRRSSTSIPTTGFQSEDFVDTLAESLGLAKVDLNRIEVTKHLIDQVPKKVARDYKIFPVEYDQTTIWVAISDPLNIQAADDLERILRKKVEVLVAKEEEIERLYKRYYEGSEISDMYQRVSTELRTDLDFMDEESTTIDVNVQEGADTPPVVKFVDLIFRQAVHDRASDIHIEPTRYGVPIRFRIDGVCHEVPSPPKKWQNAIISRLKVMSGMDLAEKRIPQDGRIKLNLGTKKLDLRVSALPAIYGESIVMRILDQSATMKGLGDVGFLPDNIAKFERLIKTPTGVILMTGPTGSGKTTTLYAALSALNNAETKIITIENPVEYMIDGINQVQVNEEVGLDFTKGLRSMLRQSPDVILVGEIRDFETAEIGIRAALTGHLVFSTLHTNDAPSAATRLIDMGIKPFLVASSIQAVIAQRLLRTLCPQCKRQQHANIADSAGLGATEEEMREGLSIHFPVGCERCSNSGYRGRTAIHEIFEIDAQIRQLIIRNEPSARLKRIAIRNGMRSLRMDGWKKVVMGQTSLEELDRITAAD